MATIEILGWQDDYSLIQILETTGADIRVSI